ncbi:MAG TPA: MFS transporter [Ktedonobacterales bacterium]|nr:MFS transporter [Ktedonobacterales bacterium]
MSETTLPETTPDPTPAPTPAQSIPSSPPTQPTERTKIGAGVGRYASYIFWLMFLINFFNYADRYIFVGLSRQIQAAYNLNDAEIGNLASAFIIVYTLTAFPLGYMADKLSRKVVVGAGVALWSLATAATALAGSLGSLLAARALVGVGEGSYYPAGTPLLAAWFTPQRRATVMSRWGVGALVGAGIGTLIAGFFASPDRWRLAFYVVGVPGLVLALLILLTRSKQRNEEDPPEDAGVTGTTFFGKLREYLSIPTLRVILAMHAMGFFALTATSAFLVIYFGAEYGRGKNSIYGAAGMSDSLVTLLPGVLLLLGGIGGGLYGGFWANRVARRRSGARVYVSALGFLYAIPFIVVTLGAPYILRALPAYHALSTTTQIAIGATSFAVFGLGASFFLNVYNGPSSAALQDVLPPHDRAGGGGLELTLAHLLGDSYAATVVGGLSYLLARGMFGQPGLGGEQIGLALLLTAPIALAISGAVGVWGSRFYASDVAKLEAANAASS